LKASGCERQDFLPDSFFVVKTLTGLLALTALASFKTRWLRRVPVLRCDVRFFGCPICCPAFYYTGVNNLFQGVNIDKYCCLCYDVAMVYDYEQQTDKLEHGPGADNVIAGDFRPAELPDFQDTQEFEPVKPELRVVEGGGEGGLSPKAKFNLHLGGLAAFGAGVAVLSDIINKT
jgi:hypothetical protein